MYRPLYGEEEIEEENDMDGAVVQEEEQVVEEQVVEEQVAGEQVVGEEVVQEPVDMEVEENNNAPEENNEEG